MLENAKAAHDGDDLFWRTQKLVAHDGLLLENAKAADTLIEVEIFILSLSSHDGDDFDR